MMIGKARKFNTAQMKRMFLWTAVFFIAAHGYRFCNNLYTSDCLVEVFQDDISWQRSLGRFMQTFTIAARGSICSPWLIGGLALVFFAISGYLICEILGIEGPFFVAATAAVLMCNETLTASAASFLPWVDVYAFALFWAVLGVWLYLGDDPGGYVLGSLAFVVSMGFYQAYIDVAMGLLLMTTLQRLWEKSTLRTELVRGIKYMVGLLASGIVYFCTYKLVCLIHHVTEADSYNSLSGLGNYGGISLGGLIAGVYGNVFSFLFRPGVFVSTYLFGQNVSSWWAVLLGISAFACLGVCAAGIVLLNRKNRTCWPERLLQIAVAAVLPMALNAVFFLSKGMEHDLMKYSFFLVYVLMLRVLQQCGDLVPGWRKGGILLLIPLSLLIWNNIVFSNQVYFKIDMEDRAALSIATRIVHDVEDTDGYEYGITPVAFAGDLDHSAYIRDVSYLRDVRVYGNGRTPFTYRMSMKVYLLSYLNVNMNLTDADEDMAEIREMPIYPAKGSIRYIGDTIVVKLSD